MDEVDKSRRRLADSGYRTIDDWLSLGRRVVEGFAPRMLVVLDGQEVRLFTGDQTEPMAPSSLPVRANDLETI